MAEKKKHFMATYIDLGYKIWKEKISIQPYVMVHPCLLWDKAHIKWTRLIKFWNSFWKETLLPLNKREEWISGLHLIWHGGALVPIELKSCTSEKAPSVLTGINRFLNLSRCLLQERPCIIYQDNAKSITTAWLHSGYI